MGHILGLLHPHTSCTFNSGPWETSDINDPDNANRGDYVQDTPVDPGMYFNVDAVNCLWNGQVENCTFSAPEPLTNYSPLTDNIMSYTNPVCMLGFTPGQVERMHCILSNAEDLEPIHFLPFEPGYDITWNSSNTPGNGDFSIVGDLIVTAGSKLTIGSDVAVRFAPQSRLIVEQGATLVLEGRLTDMACHGQASSWLGVEVWGNEDESQFPVGGVQAHGRLELKPNAIIENALTAVKLYGPTDSDTTRVFGMLLRYIQ